MSEVIQEAWRPLASLEMLRKRAAIIDKIRAFFAARQVLEVETPLMCHSSVTNPYILSITTQVQDPRSLQLKTCYLQTSPEYAMKRLLAAGSGSIYQICKAFRQDELGRIHNPEFTLLEWYRLGFDHHALMDEVDDLFFYLMQSKPAERYAYAEVFEKFLSLNPHQASQQALQTCARDHGIQMQGELDRDGWLNLLMSHCIEPVIGQDRPAFVYDYPASQASLSRIRAGDPPLASRVEVYYQGMEIGNGFHELQSSKEQRARFLADLAQRQQEGLSPIPIDEHLLAALDHGLPDCAGIAMGVDRMVMLALGLKSIDEILSFNYSNA